MASSTVKLLGILIYLFFMYFVGSIIFTKGFLLKRDVISVNSSCRVDFAQYWDGEKHGAEGCWLHRRFNKAVIILIDALRFDFVAPTNSNKDKPYINKMRTVVDLVKHKPKNARLYKFIADPPTTTLQRLKALTTGSLPTFVDAGSNFASTQIAEDNFIDQLAKLGKRMTFLGDDTWLSLFPGRFTRVYAYPSFNVKDLHTVDNGILENIYRELREKDWDVTIAHFLGVDHCGHRYGPNHPAMSEKLVQMDDMIRNVTQRLDKDTVLFVFGDHGMTPTGDHGGDSNDELDAALFVYSSSQITASKNTVEKYKTVSQIDLVPTISILLGAPVPFSNLGTVITDLVNHCSWSKDSHIKEVYHSVEALRVNAHQISEYLNQYMRVSSDLPTHKLMLLQERLHNAEMQLQSLVTNMFVNNNADNAHERLHYLENEYKEYMRQVREICKEVWARFDMTSMIIGILVLAVTLLVNIYMLCTLSVLSAEKGNGTVVIVLVLSLVFVIFSLFQSVYLDNGSVSIMAFILGLFDFIALLIIILVTRNSMRGSEKKSTERSSSFFQRMSETLKNISIDGCLIAVVFITNTLSYFSNSFVVFEDDMVLFLTQTCILFFFMKTVFTLLKEAKLAKNVSKLVKADIKRFNTHSVIIVAILALACSLCVRLSVNFRTKREEQMTEQEVAGEADDSDTNKNVSYFFNASCLLVSIYLLRKWLKDSGNLNGTSFATLCARYLMPMAGVMTVMYWAIQRLPNKVLDALPAWQQVFLPQTVYVIIALSFIAYAISPKLIYALPKQNRQIPVCETDDDKDIFHKVFRYVKSNWRGDHSLVNDNHDEVPKVFGIGTVYSASVVYNGINILLLLSLLLGEKFSPSILTGICAIFCFLELFIISVKLCRESDLLLNGLLTLTLLTASYFYGFGHQATIPAIRFEAAYVGFSGDWDMKIIPAALIHCNMFASEILFTFLAPLLILWPCTRGVIAEYISLFKDSRETHWKGDFIMQENPAVFSHLQMKMFFSLYLYHGLKLFASILAATVHKRHLMVWKIFAPRFVYQAMSSFTVFTIAIVVVLVISRVNSSLTRWAMKLKST